MYLISMKCRGHLKICLYLLDLAQKITFPANVGWPIGETNETEYWKLEIHYDNPKSLSGVLINAGVNVFYTDQLRYTYIQYLHFVFNTLYCIA